VKIPNDVLSIFEAETDGLDFGEITLTVHLRDGNPRYTIGRERSIFSPTLTKGVADSYTTTNYRDHLDGMRNRGENK